MTADHSADPAPAGRVAWIVFDPKDKPLFREIRDTREDAMWAAFGPEWQRSGDRRWNHWERQLQDGWTCRAVSLDAHALAAGAAAGVAWQPIETAPKDSTIIIAAYGDHPVRPAYWDGSCWVTIGCITEGGEEPHFWQPLPYPPPAAPQAAAVTGSLGDTVEIDYTNYRGERSIRTVIPTGRLLPGDDTYHPGARWVIEAFDPEKDAMRTFDPAHIHRWGDQEPRSSAKVFRQALADAKASLTDAGFAFDGAPPPSDRTAAGTGGAREVAGAGREGVEPDETRRDALAAMQEIDDAVRQYGEVYDREHIGLGAYQACSRTLKLLPQVLASLRAAGGALRGEEIPDELRRLSEAALKLYEVTSLVSIGGGGEPPKIQLSFATLNDCHAAVDALYVIAPLSARQARMAARLDAGRGEG